MILLIKGSAEGAPSISKIHRPPLRIIDFAGDAKLGHDDQFVVHRERFGDNGICRQYLAVGCETDTRFIVSEFRVAQSVRPQPKHAPVASFTDVERAYEALASAGVPVVACRAPRKVYLVHAPNLPQRKNAVDEVGALLDGLTL